MKNKLFIVLLLGLWTGVTLAQGNTSPDAVLTGSGPQVITENMRTQLVSAYTSVAPGQSFTIAMRQQIRPHWHTYWRNPGDSGEPTALEWDLPAGWRVSGIEWPAPQRIQVGPLVNFGYSDEVLLLFTLEAPQDLEPGHRLELNAEAYWLVCEEICIPEEGRLSLQLNIEQEPRASPWRERLEAARAALPQTLPWPIETALANNQLSIQLPIPRQASIQQASYFPYHKDVIQNAAEQALSLDQQGLTLRIPTAFAATPDRLAGILVLTEQSGDAILSRAYRISPDNRATSRTSESNRPTWWLALILAFAGGLLLNLMPCVFPVLSIKVLALVELANRDTETRQTAGTRHGLLYSLGVLLGFGLLAGLLIALRAGGEAIGWGFQLQNPLLVLLLCWLFFVIGLNLSGLFSFGTRFSGAGQSLTQGEGSKQSFFTGLLATLVATPCTAPFMGIALGYALLQPALLTLLIFLVLGLGMATPMALLSRFPGWLRWLPPPGVWMERLRQFLAFPMYLSSLWMLWVYQKQVGDTGILIGGVGLVLWAFLFWSRNLGQRFIRRVVIAASAVSLGGLLVISAWSKSIPEPSAVHSGWQDYSTQRLQQARPKGPVFVNFTADWCITCKVNERVALTPRVDRLFEKKQVTRLRADWTLKDERIAREIELHGRSGVPLYLWYATSGFAQPEILPQLLSEQMLIDRLEALP